MEKPKGQRPRPRQTITTMKYLYTILLVAACTLLATNDILAQNYNIRGTVHDDTDSPLPGGTVVAMEASDSTLVSFGTTRKDGEFQLRRVPAGDYIVKITFVGFKVHVQKVTVETSDINIGMVKMEEAIAELGELVVTEERIPIIVKADTVVYDASAFKVRAYANVEELLQRLPGIEVERDGTIIAQGEEVQKVLVDGKEFFGDDPKIATKNLQAQAIKKVEVFDKKSDVAEFTGVDDGNEQKTINLQLKDEFKAGYFGSVEGGVGPDQHYDGRVNINRFNETTQLALLGNGTDVGSSGFGDNEFVQLAGARGGGGNGFSGLSGGLNESWSGGLNAAHSFKKDSKIEASYFLNGSDNLIDGNVLRQQLAGNSISTESNQNGINRAERLNHRLNLDLEHEFNPLNSFRMRVRGNNSNTDDIENTVSEVSARNNLTKSLINNLETGDRLGGSTSATYIHRFGASARNIVANMEVNLNDNNTETDLETTTEFLIDGDLLNIDEIRQLQSNKSQTLGLETELSYTEPIGGIKFLEFRWQNEQDLRNQDQNVFDRLGNELLPNDSLTTGFDRRYSHNQLRTMLRFDGEDTDVSFGVSVQASTLKGEIDDFGVPISNNYFHVLPQAEYRAGLGRGKFARVSYNARTAVPSLQQLQPIIDNSDPLRVFVGNPDLIPSYSHNFRTDFRWFDQFTFMSIYAGIRASYTHNKIANNREISDRFVQTITPLNIDGDWTLGGFQNFAYPVRAIGMQVNLSNSLYYQNSAEFINSIENETKSLRDAVKLTLGNRNKELFDVDFGLSLTFHNNRFSLNQELNQSYVNRSFFLDLAFTPDDKWRVSTSVDAARYADDVFGQGGDVTMWSAEVSRSLMANNRAYVALVGKDLLNEGLGVNYTNSPGLIQESRILSVGRYGLVKFVYNLSNNGADGGGGRGGRGGRGRF